MKPDIRTADNLQPDKQANAHTGHRQRMRDKILKNGVDALAEHEVLEVLLYPVVPRRDTNLLAHQLLKRYGSLANVLDANPLEVQQMKGISPNAAFHLHYMALVTASYMQSKYRQRLIYGSTQAFINHVKALFPAEVCEVAYMLCLDNSMRLINTIKLAQGTRYSVDFPVSDVVRIAVTVGAKNVVLAHNHPSGRLKPSDEDLKLTQKCLSALELVNINLHDHLIVCGQACFSFIEQGYMKAIYQNELDKKKELADREAQKAAENGLGGVPPAQLLKDNLSGQSVC